MLLSPPKIGTTVRTLITTYGARQKDQVVNLTRIPSGSVGTVRHMGYDEDTAGYALTVFRFPDGTRLFAKLGLTTIEEVQDATGS